MAGFTIVHRDELARDGKWGLVRRSLESRRRSGWGS